MIPKMRFWTGSHMIYMDSARNIESITNCYAQQLLYDVLKDIEGPRLYPAYDHIGEHGAAFMLSTGLSDENGREIYEGDIVRLVGGQCRIEFVNGCFWARSLESNWSILPHLWVNETTVGNVYENPELLETAPEAQDG